MENLQNTSVQQKPQRPTFLTVLCVLSFLGSGIGIISNLSGYLNADVQSAFQQEKIEETKEKIDKQLDDGEEGKELADRMLSDTSAITDPAKKKKDALYSFFANVLSLAGAVLMFRLKREGFYLYVAGILISILSPLYVFGTGNLVSMGISIAVGFVGIIFILLYYLNLKYLS